MPQENQENTYKSVYVYVQAHLPNKIFVSKDKIEGAERKLFLLFDEKRDFQKKTIANFAKAIGCKEISIFGEDDKNYALTIGNKKIFSTREHRQFAANIFLSKKSQNIKIVSRLISEECIVLANMDEEGHLEIFQQDGMLFAFSSTHALSNFLSKHTDYKTDGFTPLSIEVKRLPSYLNNKKDLIAIDKDYRFNEYETEYFLNGAIIDYVKEAIKNG